jgi:hypothetical protein
MVTGYRLDYRGVRVRGFHFSIPSIPAMESTLPRHLELYRTEESGRSVKLTTRLQLVKRSTNRGYIHPLPICLMMKCSGSGSGTGTGTGTGTALPLRYLRTVCFPHTFLLAFECLDQTLRNWVCVPISTANFINISHMYVYPLIVARQRLSKKVTAATNTRAT